MCSIVTDLKAYKQIHNKKKKHFFFVNLKY